MTKHNTILEGLLSMGLGEKIGSTLDYYKFVNSGFDIDDKISKGDAKLKDMLTKLKEIQSIKMQQTQITSSFYTCFQTQIKSTLNEY